MSAPKSGFAAFKKSVLQNWQLYILVLPALIYMIIFLYWPMHGIIIAFKDFTPSKGILGSPWARQMSGETDIFKHFTNFFTSIHFKRTIRNTLTLSLYSLTVNWPIPIVFAILINEIRSPKLKKTVQTITYLPHFISTVVMCGMLWIFLRNETGMINYMLKAIGVGNVNFMYEPKYFAHVYVWSGVWQGTGWNTIIYMSTLSGLDTQMYEAAGIDGANKWQQTLGITLPLLRPVISIMFIMNVGHILSTDFGLFFQVTRDSNSLINVTQTLDVYVYKALMQSNNYNYSSAVALLQSVFGCILLIIANRVVKRIDPESGIF